MTIFESLRMALESITGNKLRSVLTMLGVVIGVASMQTMVALVEGARKDVKQQLGGLGARSIYVVPKQFDPKEAPESEWRGRSRGTRMTDVAVLERLPGVKEARPQVAGVNTTVAARGNSVAAEVNGVSPKEIEASDLKLWNGRFFIPSDLDAVAKVTVLGSGVAKKLFGDDNPVGSIVMFNGVSYEVIGVLAERGGRGGQDFDRMVFVPITTAQKRLLGSDSVPVVVVEADEGTDIDQLTARVKTEMRALHSNVEDFDAISQKAILEAVGKVLAVIGLVLGGVGGLSLLVGGIGIMNIMLVTVTERTREIGIRKAIGARKRDIMLQFIIESVVLAGIGGVLGATLGWLMTQGFGAISKDLKFYVPLWAVFVSFGFAFATGAFFGIYPAMRAARLDPIEALRYE